MKIVAIVQARMGSIRFPGKVMQPILGTPLIGILLHRLKLSKRIQEIVLATSTSPDNASLIEYVEGLGVHTYLGREDDVLDRFYRVAKNAQAEVVVRITGDCPLTDPELVDEVIDHFKKSGVAYCSNLSPPTYPDGLDIEVFSFDSLEMAHQLAREPAYREHVSLFIRENKIFTKTNFALSMDNYSSERWTVDEVEDFEVIKKVIGYYHPRIDFSWREVLELRKDNPGWFATNRKLERNEGGSINTGQKLWKRAKRVIPGGNMLLSKRAEMFLPNQWPTYFSKAKGCKLWDLDGKEYFDVSLMGVGTNTLGYSNPEVDAAVQVAIGASNMSTLNCPEEVYLAEKLLEIHPWADMVRFARSGGETNAIAVRIARAASGKDKVAICGYHGWHDWYLAANLASDQYLSGHLLPGLQPAGVPLGLQNTVFPFRYNQFDELQDIVACNPDIGVIKMEVTRSEEPQFGFLEKVRHLANDNNIVLIFDECTTGFRQTFGGIHKLYGVDPDMAVFGKALGNGYAITAVIGRREIMESAQSTFISSTFWTERIGPVAGLKTLEVMERTQSWQAITETGILIKQRWDELAKKNELEIDHWGIPSLAGFTIKTNYPLAAKTLITQEMLKKGYLASNNIYSCTEHTPAVLDGYFEALDSTFGVIKQSEMDGNIMALLEGPICHDGFHRLN